MKTIEGRYWNSSGKGVAVVASITEDIDTIGKIKSKEGLIEGLAKIVCTLSDDPKECTECRKEQGCPDSWPDVKEKVDEILTCLSSHGFGDIKQAKKEVRKQVGLELEELRNEFFIRVNIGHDKPDYRYTIDPRSLQEKIESLKKQEGIGYKNYEYSQARVPQRIKHGW